MNEVGLFWVLACGGVAVSYVLGSIPTGFWLGLRIRGIDIREHGSKNIGATNTLRVLGKGLGAAALLGDMLKGILAVCLGYFLIGPNIRDIGRDRFLIDTFIDWQYLPLACGIAAILGHSFSIFLGFKGGKGVATSAGVFLALLPIPTLVAAVVFGITVWVSRMVSLGSILAALTLMAVAFVVPVDMVMRVIVMLMGVLVIWKHRSNIGRILRGEESKF